MKTKVFLADLTHVGQSLASYTFPLGIASIASYTQEKLGDQVDVSLFKYPEKLSEAVIKTVPHVVGFSNYVWNFNLSYTFACKIKKHFPQTVIVFGGPNYDSDKAACNRFLRQHSVIDFYVHQEGESAFTELVRRLIDQNFNIEAVKKTIPPSCHFLYDGELVLGELADRIRNLNEIPSPYTMGLMDQFFDGKLMPLIQTNRGCPFTCSFCVEGHEYYNKVRKGPTERAASELQYIAHRITGIPDLRIADSNFAMYAQDMDICREIAKVQEEYGWPRYIHVATGKNQKERVLEGAEIINGSMRLSASVQSMDDKVLTNIKRQGISTKDVIEVARRGNALGSNTYSEIILCLPGDTKDAHYDSIKKVVDANLNSITLITLMMLPGTEMATRESREQYKMDVRFRVLPRCFGSYAFVGEIFHSVETEEVCVANNTMSYDDYLDCRVMGLFVEVFYNDGIFEEILGLLNFFNISSFDWVNYLHDHRDEFSMELQHLIHDFRKETHDELWRSREELEAFANDEETINRYVSGKYGSNLIFKYKVLMLLRHGESVNHIAFHLTKMMFQARGLVSREPWLETYLEDLRVFSAARKTSTFDTSTRETRTFNFDLKTMEQKGFRGPPLEHSTPDGTTLSFQHSEEQEDYIHKYLDVYGDSLPGLTRIVSLAHIKSLYRSIIYDGSDLNYIASPVQSFRETFEQR